MNASPLELGSVRTLRRSSVWKKPSTPSWQSCGSAGAAGVPFVDESEVDIVDG